MPDDADIGSFYKDVRDAYIKLFLHTIKWAKNANIKLINMHIPKGSFMTLPDKKVYINEKYAELYIDNFITSLSVIAKSAHENNIIICIENSSNFHLTYVENLLGKALELDNIYLTWDVGHDYVSNFTDREVLLKYEDKISHMHLHDANKHGDHKALLDGDLEIMKLLDFATKKNLTVLIEVKSKEALIISKQILKEKFAY